MPTIDQIRAARALLNWSQTDLADRAGLSQTGIARIESGVNMPNSSTLDKIAAAFDSAGIEFIADRGVEKRDRGIRVLRGQKGFIEFMDDVHDEMLRHGGQMCVSNVDEHNWIKWMGRERYDQHAARMAQIKPRVKSRIIIKENDYFFIAHEFAEYRWFPEKLFNAQSFYAYGSKLALIDFQEEDVSIMILEQVEFTQGFMILFDIAWNNVATVPLSGESK
jgi:transcriptional regulator with XRE-family HTH domain